MTQHIDNIYEIAPTLNINMNSFWYNCLVNTDFLVVIHTISYVGKGLRCKCLQIDHFPNRIKCARADDKFIQKDNNENEADAL